MAVRQVYKVNDTGIEYVKKVDIDFTWSPGFAACQKQKNIRALQGGYNEIYLNDRVLEISSKSELALGVNLSAFNLTITTMKKNQTFSVESAFQSSKKFKNGGPYLDILNKDSRSAKKDERLKTSGELIGFTFFNIEWPLEPKTLFYDWLYMNALYKQKELAEEILNYDAFTDIEFNPSKSINCQAYSAALFVSLSRRHLIDEAMNSIEKYKEIITGSNFKPKNETSVEQITFLQI
jgi:type I restriction enzyme M protein